MGWDVVEIGLRHDLPVDDPIATAQEVAKRMKQNVRLVYRNEFEYDIENNVVSISKGPDFIEIGKYEVNYSKDYLKMIASNYQANKIQELVGIDKLRKATFASDFAEFIIDDLEDAFELYEIVSDEVDIRIFKENVDLDVYIGERWKNWERALHQLNSDKDKEWLRNYRMQIYNRAQLFGCKEVIICSDQGPTQSIFANMHYSSEDLKEYAHSLQYFKDCKCSASEADEWKKHAKHVMFSSLFQNQLVLSDKDFIEVIYDDFSDIGES